MGETTVNYNRDVEIFPVLNTIFEKIYGESPYKSPTDMGVNMAWNCCICDDEACREASKQEIIRRYFDALNALLKGDASSEKEAEKIELLMNMAGITVTDRKVVIKALERAKETDGPAAALELRRWKDHHRKNFQPARSKRCPSVKCTKSAGIDHKLHIISPEAIEPIQKLKVDYLNSKNPRLPAQTRS